jgi:hypothetical protein
MPSHIEIFVYSYRNKNLLNVIENLYSSILDNNFTVFVVDQNNVDRELLFKKFDNLQYKFRHWDSIKSPCELKMNFLNRTIAEYSMILSDDVMLSKGWDKELCDFLNLGSGKIVSGHTVANLSQKDLFSISNNPIWDNKFSLSQHIDRNFIFGKTKDLQKTTYPGELKYYGEEEVYAMNLLSSGLDIYSAPSETYRDLEVRTLESTYVPFSKYHNYNKFYEYTQHTIARRFLDHHGIDPNALRLLPDINNDVSYLHTDLDFVSLDGNKFLETPNRIS